MVIFLHARCARISKACCCRVAEFWQCHIALAFADCVLTLVFSHLSLVLEGPNGSRPPEMQTELVVTWWPSGLQVEVWTGKWSTEGVGQTSWLLGLLGDAAIRVLRHGNLTWLSWVAVVLQGYRHSCGPGNGEQWGQGRLLLHLELCQSLETQLSPLTPIVPLSRVTSPLGLHLQLKHNLICFPNALLNVVLPYNISYILSLYLN